MSATATVEDDPGKWRTVLDLWRAQREGAAGLAHRRHCHQRAGAAMEVDQFGDVDVGDTVAIGEAERLVAEILPHALDAAARHRLLAGVHQRHPPGLDAVAVGVHGVVVQVERHIGARQDVVAEVLLDHVALVAAADHEIVEAVGRVDLHDVPEDRLAADLDQRLGPDGAFLADAGAVAARQDDHLHVAVSASSMSLQDNGQVCPSPSDQVVALA